MGDEEKEVEGWEDSLKEYVSQYIAEAKDIIPKIEEELFSIERKEGDETELINSLFRRWHTIKGAAGFLGFERTIELAHKTESLIAKLRDEKISFTEDIINTVFDALEKLKLLTENIELSGSEGDISIEDEARKLDIIMSKITGMPIEEEKKESYEDEEKGFAEPEGVEVRGKVEEREEKEIYAKNGKEKEKEKEKEIERKQKEGHEAERGKKEEKVIDFKEGISKEAIKEDKRKKEKEGEKEKEKEEETRKLEEEGDEKKKRRFAYETIRVATQKIDEVMALSEELILERNFLMNMLPKIEEKYPRDEDIARMSEVSANMDKIISMLRFAVMKMRMIPLRMLFSKFPGTVRNLARHFGKKVEFIMEGEDTELDRNIVDELEEPLIHIIRNSIDHGIERPEERIAYGKKAEGEIKLKAYYEGDNVVIEVEDDGRGIDARKIGQKALEKGLITQEQLASMSEKDMINIIFMPGFSSKDEATELSGRGVGMDVVRNKIVKLKGTLDIETEVGRGTKIIMKLPLTVGIMNTLKVSCNGAQFFIPLSSVIEINRISKVEMKYASRQAIINWRNNLIPVIYLGNVFGMPENGNNNMYHLIVAGIAEKRIGILVDSVISSEEIAVKTISGIKAQGIAGATISAEGEPVLVVDIYSVSKYLEEMK